MEVGDPNTLMLAMKYVEGWYIAVVCIYAVIYNKLFHMTVARLDLIGRCMWKKLRRRSRRVTGK